MEAERLGRALPHLIETIAALERREDAKAGKTPLYEAFKTAPS